MLELPIDWGTWPARAVVLDPLDARSLAVSGHTLVFLHRRLSEAIAIHERALSLNPNLAMASALSCVAHAYAGNLEEAERCYKSLSPFDLQAVFFDAFLVLINLMKRSYEAAFGGRQARVRPSLSASLLQHQFRRYLRP